MRAAIVPEQALEFTFALNATEGIFADEAKKIGIVECEKEFRDWAFQSRS